MGSHQSAAMGRDEWLTPPEILRELGPFDLDPCAPSESRRPWETALRHFSIEDDGLKQCWGEGRVWLNPPYGRGTGQWLRRLASHGRGTALVFARTETADWHSAIWPLASAVLFLEGRLYFHDITGRRAVANAGAPSALVAYGSEDAGRLLASSLAGQFVFLRRHAA